MNHKSFFLCLWIWFSHGVIGDRDEVKSVSVTEGDSVSLNSGVSEVQRNDYILWIFNINNSDTHIAEIHKQVIDMYDSNEIFGDRLQVDSQTGSLTIRNIRSEHSGLYKLTIIKAGVTYTSFFSVAVYVPLPSPVITRDTSNCSSSSSSSKRSSVSRCVLLCSAVNVEYQENNIYSCVINNPITNQTTHLDITQLCPEFIPHSQTVVISVIVIVLIVVVAAVVIILCNKKCKQACPEETR